MILCPEPKTILCHPRQFLLRTHICTLKFFLQKFKAIPELIVTDVIKHEGTTAALVICLLFVSKRKRSGAIIVATPAFPAACLNRFPDLFRVLVQAVNILIDMCQIQLHRKILLAYVQRQNDPFVGLEIIYAGPVIPAESALSYSGLRIFDDEIV